MGTPPQVSFFPEKPTKRYPHSASSTYSPAPSTPAASRPHHTAHRDGKAWAQRNATLAPAHRHNRTDTIEHRALNGTPDPTPRWGKLTGQEVPGQQQAPGTSIPHHAPATTLTHHITATATIVSLSDELTPPSYFPMSKGIAQSSSPSNGSGLP
ncbi:hypothetical protein ATANTOWER_031436 [Ataeniobius toweri]|uniref:Uncharacterized protein n=1 Tax=Ataeniobius toweri TaxID=208326 RepID=A0ABU7CN66_9TELE|nr:hypothetical protein [Ataeniobius toweri]